MNNEIEIEKTDLKEKKIYKQTLKQDDLHDQFFFSERNQFYRLDNVKVFKDEDHQDDQVLNDEKRNQIAIESKQKDYNYLIPPLTRIGSDKSSSSSSVSSEKNLITNKFSSSTFSLSKRKPVGNLTPTKFEYLNNKSSKQYNKFLINPIHQSTNLDGNLSDNSSPHSSSNRSTPDSQINRRSHCSTTCFKKHHDAFQNFKQAYSTSNLFDSCPNLNIHKLIYNDKNFKPNSAFTLPAFSSTNLALSSRNLPKNAK